MANSLKQILEKLSGSAESLELARTETLRIQSELDKSKTDLAAALDLQTKQSAEVSRLTTELAKSNKDLETANASLSTVKAESETFKKRLEDPAGEIQKSAAEKAAKTLRGLGVQEPVSEPASNSDAATSRDKAVALYQAETDPVKRSAIFEQYLGKSGIFNK